MIGSDVDGDILTYSLLEGATHGMAVVNPDGSWIYIPDANYNGTDSFTVKVDDGNGGIAVSTINITVTPVNNLPVVGNYEVETLEGIMVTGTVIGSDADGDTLTYSLLAGATHRIAVVNPDGSWTYTPDANYNGTDSFTVKVDDGNGGTATSTINIIIIGTPISRGCKYFYVF